MALVTIDGVLEFEEGMSPKNSFTVVHWYVSRRRPAIAIFLKVHLFVMSQRVVGCLVAEPIKEAHKVLSCTVCGSSDGSTTDKTKESAFEFGDIKFRREVIRKPLFVPEALNEHLNGAIICKKEAVPAICGVRAIWVTPANRRKHIASQLLDALRKSFCMGFVLECSQLAFSELTSAGNALASNYVGRDHVLVYNTFNT